MISELLLLFYEFFKIGLFSVGGGLATLPFLYRLAEKYDWFTNSMIADMIAVSESTPGPLGINMATFTGFQNLGPLGSLGATVGLVFPSVVIIIWISKFLQKFRENKHVEEVFYTIRPVVTGMIGAAGASVIISSLFRITDIKEIMSTGWMQVVGVKECILFLVVFIASNKLGGHPIFYIVLGAVVGVLFQF